MNEIKNLIDQQCPDQEESKQEQNLLDSIIAKLFGMQRISDSKIMELQHRIEMNALGAEDLESVKFDLEMAD